MSLKLVHVGVLALATCCCAPCWAANVAEDAFQEAQQLVASGDLLAAKKALVTAVKAERSNPKYLQQYLLVSQAIKLQEAVKTQKDPRRWESAAQSLSLFYTTHDLYAQALPVDEAIFKRSKTADAAVQFAETLLALKKFKQAAEVLSGLAPQQATTASQALLCVSLARQGDLSEAKRVEAGLQTTSAADSFTLYLTARAHAAVGETTRALTTLTRCYESVPPSRLEPLKSHTKLCSEFAGMASSDAFAQVLKTQSKVPESKCSGGSSCSSCPMRGNCSHD